jgi:cytochrome P450
VLLSFGSANRDERRYADADMFDLRRNPVDHVGFGYGPHGCADSAGARMQAAALLQSLIARVEAFEPAVEPVRRIHPIIRGYERVRVTVQACRR